MRNEIVILEDNDERQQQMLARLRDRLPPCPVVFFKSAHQMLAYLPEQLANIRIISLDHDLEPEHPTDPDPGTGRDVSNCLIEHAPCCPVILHSTNVHAVIAMEADLHEHGWQVTRVTPYDDLTWIDREWFWAVREALLSPALEEAQTYFPPFQ